MIPAWAQRKEKLLSDCIVSPDVFNPMVDRLRDVVVPYQHALEAEAGQGHVHLYLTLLVNPTLASVNHSLFPIKHYNMYKPTVSLTKNYIVHF